jgi:hypothetical protein
VGQEPNIEVTEAERPRPTPQPPPARRWRPDIKPGIPTSPDEVPSGGRFGQVTPDGGWGLRLINRADLPDDDPDLKAVIGALALARAGALGRGPVPEDIEVALALAGYGYDAPQEVADRRERWMAAVPHEVRPGQTAVGEVDRGLLVETPDQVRRALGGAATGER